MTTEDLIMLLDSMRQMLISVSTGGPRIQEVEARYGDAYRRVAEDLRGRNLKNPIPFPSLWDWHGKWSGGNLPSYASRRAFIGDIFNPLTDALLSGPTQHFEPTGWQRIDRTIQSARNYLIAAQTEESFQTVGLLCREILITLGQAVWVLERHPSLDGVQISPTDAKRQLEAYIGAELAMVVNDAARKHARAALDLAVALQHRRTATFRDAAMCLEGTVSVVNLIAIVEGRRDRAASFLGSATTLANIER